MAERRPDLRSVAAIDGVVPEAGAVLRWKADGTAENANPGDLLVTPTGASTPRTLADVIQPNPLPASFNIVVAGDSISAGSGVAAGERWSALIPDLSQFAGRVSANTNTSVGGRTVADLVTAYAAEVYPLRPAVSGKPTYLFVAVGANNVEGGAGTLAAIEALRGYWATAKADGFTVVAFTVMMHYDAITGAIRTFNSAVRSSAGWDYLVDEALVLADPWDPYFFTDGTHPLAAGHELIAGYINSVFGGPAVPLAAFEGQNSPSGYRGDYTNLRAATGLGNTGVGAEAGKAITTGSSNTAVGAEAAEALTTETDNTAVGAWAMRTAAGGSNNTAVGSTALNRATGSYNVAVGGSASALQTTGAFNTAVGEEAGKANLTGASNVAVGFKAATASTSSNNTAVGALAALAQTAGLQNTAVGSNALAGNTSGSHNVALGYGAGAFQPDGTTPLIPVDSVYIGAGSKGLNNSDSNSIVIGKDAVGEGANTTVVGTAATTKTHLYGALQIGAAGAPTIDWGTAAPAAGTWIAGSVRWNSAVAVGQPNGWRCTVAGTPGTWVAMANL
jgi:lysophospholipase L1-like esterase